MGRQRELTEERPRREQPLERPRRAPTRREDALLRLPLSAEPARLDGTGRRVRSVWALAAYLVVSFLHGPRIASALTLAVGALLVWLWFALPLAGRR